MITIGLTGGIASGKSTVSNILKNRGIPIIDADKIAREIVVPGSPILNRIAFEFGFDVLLENGELNRKKLADIVFNDDTKLKKLNEIMHPEIFRIIQKEIELQKINGEKISAVDAALLIEAGLYKLVDYVVLIYVDINTQIERLMKRDKKTKEDALKIIKAQMSIEEKIKYADFIIDNSKDLEYTVIQINKIISSIETSEDRNE